MANAELSKFVADSRAHGVTDPDIRAQLTKANWPETEINLALGPTIPVPAAAAMPPSYHPKASNSDMWVVFEYVLMFITLAVSATGLAGLLHNLVDTKISPLNDQGYGLSYYTDTLVPGYIAALIIAFPIFAALALVLRNRLEKTPEVRRIKVRKVFIYIALTWTFAVLLTRFIRTVYSFLNGDAVVVNILLHLVVTSLIAGAIFAYFVFEIKQDNVA